MEKIKLSNLVRVLERVEKIKQLKKREASNALLYTEINQLRKDIEKIENSLTKDEWNLLKEAVWGLIE